MLAVALLCLPTRGLKCHGPNVAFDASLRVKNRYT